jgi:hypothetical protein
MSEALSAECDVLDMAEGASLIRPTKCNAASIAKGSRINRTVRPNFPPRHWHGAALSKGGENVKHPAP